MKIKVEVDIFDDPEFCHSIDNRCGFIVSGYGWKCMLFKTELTTTKSKYDPPYENFVVKCDECKFFLKTFS